MFAYAPDGKDGSPALPRESRQAPLRTAADNHSTLREQLIGASRVHRVAAWWGDLPSVAQDHAKRRWPDLSYVFRCHHAPAIAQLDHEVGHGPEICLKLHLDPAQTPAHPRTANLESLRLHR
jgi:hypothetical protein